MPALIIDNAAYSGAYKSEFIIACIVKGHLNSPNLFLQSQNSPPVLHLLNPYHTTPLFKISSPGLTCAPQSLLQQPTQSFSY